MEYFQTYFKKKMESFSNTFTKKKVSIVYTYMLEDWIGCHLRCAIPQAASPHDSDEFLDADHFSIYFLHDPLDFVFTLAENLTKIENFLILSRSR
jgi:hypothetical protein